MKNQSKHLALGQNIAHNQRISEQLTPQQAIILSHSETGKVPLVIDRKTTIMVEAGCDMVERREHYLRKYTK